MSKCPLICKWKINSLVAKKSSTDLNKEREVFLIYSLFIIYIYIKLLYTGLHFSTSTHLSISTTFSQPAPAKQQQPQTIRSSSPCCSNSLQTKTTFSAMTDPKFANLPGIVCAITTKQYYVHTRYIICNFNI